MLRKEGPGADVPHRAVTRAGPITRNSFAIHKVHAKFLNSYCAFQGFHTESNGFPAVFMDCADSNSTPALFMENTQNNTNS